MANKNKITCLNIITRFSSGGAEESVMDMILQLAELGIFCDVAIGKELIFENFKKFNLPTQCKIHRIPHLIRNIHPIHDFLALQELKKLIKRNNYNIVHTHTSKAGILGRIAAHQVHTPIIIGSIHGVSFESCSGLTKFLYKQLEKYTAKLSTSLICVGENIQQTYLEENIGQKDQYKVIYTGMDLQPYKTAGNELQKNNKKRIAIRTQLGLTNNLETCVLSYIGRLTNGKNQHEIITMMPEILKLNPHTQLCLIGDGPAKEELQKLTKKLNIENNVIFAGYIPCISKILPAFDINCFTSKREGLPRVLVQTSAACIPTVSYLVSGANEIIEEGKSGFIVNQGDTHAFLEKLLFLINDKKSRLQFGKHAMKKADSRWSLATLGTQTKQLYENLLQQI